MQRPVQAEKAVALAERGSSRTWNTDHTQLLSKLPREGTSGWGGGGIQARDAAGRAIWRVHADIEGGISVATEAPQQVAGTPQAQGGALHSLTVLSLRGVGCRDAEEHARDNRGWR